MLRLRYLGASLIGLASCAAESANFVDNPNLTIPCTAKRERFATPARGWNGNFGHARLVDYVEKTDDAQWVRDSYLELRPETDRGGTIFYQMKDVGPNAPLFAYVEASFSSEVDRCEVTLTLRESGVHPRTNADGLLFSSKMVLTRSDTWVALHSSHPVFKTSKKNDLYLIVSYQIDSPGAVLINYAQVGSDPTRLGGRGQRLRVANASEETFLPGG